MNYALTDPLNDPRTTHQIFRAKIRALELISSTALCILFGACAAWYIHDPTPGAWDTGDLLLETLYALSAGIFLRVAIGLLTFTARLGRFQFQR